MKPKECAKYVFYNAGCYYRLRKDGRMIDELFPDLAYMFQEAHVRKVEFLCLGKNPAMAWIDKHGNIVVRVHHDNTQTKINF